jgi:biofilm PGA synthesis N-glycosyltransferase PgaC
VGNTDRKAGALNQALASLRETLTEADVLLVLDADTSLGAEFIEAGLAAFAADPDLDAVVGLISRVLSSGATSED